MRIKSLIPPTAAAVVVLVVALVLAVSGSSKLAPASASSVARSGKTVRVKVYMFAFVPAKLTVKVGTRITFTNHDQTAHTATALNGTFDTGTINPGKSRTIVVKRSGTYAYHCLFHGFMTGTIKVVN